MKFILTNGLAEGAQQRGHLALRTLIHWIIFFGVTQKNAYIITVPQLTFTNHGIAFATTRGMCHKKWYTEPPKIFGAAHMRAHEI